MSCGYVLAFLASLTVVAAETVVAANAPSPPPFVKRIDWAQLGAILGGLYAFVMIMVIISFCCCKRQTQPQIALMEGGGDASTTSNMTRRVDRGSSAWAKARTEPPAFDLSTIEKSIKMAFVRKVYSILATQLGITVAIVLGFVYAAFVVEDGGPNPTNPTALGGWILTNGLTVILVSLIPVLMILCCLHGMKNRYPHNYVLLFFFTIFESVSLAFLCVFYYAAGYGDQIILAAALTLIIVLVLTLFTMQTRIDWSFLGPALITCLFIMMFWSFFTFWFVPMGSFVPRQLISLFGAIIFSLFIVYDTNNIMKYFGVDDYIIAAVELYLDVINLFRYLLMLLAASSRS